jgi:hypothetical protein
MSGHTLFKMGPFWHSFPGRELCQSPKRVPKQLHGRSGRKIRSLEQFGCGEAAKGQLPPLRPALYQDCPGWGPQEGGGLFFFEKQVAVDGAFSGVGRWTHDGRCWGRGDRRRIRTPTDERRLIWRPADVVTGARDTKMEDGAGGQLNGGAARIRPSRLSSMASRRA